ncbi:Hypothetical predicted protein [Cloeon dipterum]|uniref:Methionyl-tRNA formyltransferase, mitochondrial n=1 Tax=Cloeon dipterum TaxID=197152 RepID=A0A8S1EEE7_9INSE|nr:Hypothetical predicted protein [Cloeon dipterum]
MGTIDSRHQLVPETYITHRKTGEHIKSLSVVCAYMKCPVAQYSLKNKINIIPWKPQKDQLQGADVGFVVSFGHLIPQSIISSFPLGMVNVHASLLPRWRGAAPIIHTVLNAETETGVTLMKIRPHRFDCGEIIGSSKLKIAPQEDAGTLTRRLASLGSAELQSCLKSLTERLGQAKPQTETGASYAPKVDASMSCCKWAEMTASQLHRRHLALHHVFPLHADWQGQTVKFLECSPMEKTSSLSPGFVDFSKKHRHLEVTCNKQSVLTVNQLKLSGKKVMSAMDFVNGFLKKVPVDLWKFGNGECG